jgi:ubiquinone/menaquinone biosynthesis C-methylase UbiE
MGKEKEKVTSMPEDLNPQLEQMADESMVRNLAAQALAIWPQERELFLRGAVRPGARILDAGCGTGEISSRLAELFPDATVDGVDIIGSHLDLARGKYPHLADRLRFTEGDVFQLGFPDETFDLTVCRHVLQAIPHAERVIRELARLTRSGGWLHLIVEDYGMIHMAPTRLDVQGFWNEGPVAFERATGTDLHIGRNAFSIMTDLGFREVTLDYVVVDTLRVPRETFARIWEAWRDGYTDPIAKYTRFARQEVVELWEDMIACIRSPRGYAVWQVPVLRARKPGRGSEAE